MLPRKSNKYVSKFMIERKLIINLRGYFTVNLEVILNLTELVQNEQMI
jgi:hypothetical protein